MVTIYTTVGNNMIEKHDFNWINYDNINTMSVKFSLTIKISLSNNNFVPTIVQHYYNWKTNHSNLIPIFLNLIQFMQK